MVPKLHKKGSSFKGAAKYLLHDKDRAISSKRVAWTQARNIAVNDPDMAWRIMAATAIDQGRLKDNAGIKSTGRKSSTPVLHLTLAWHPEEKETLNQHEMKLAATGAIEALGAEDHQSLIISHNDETHPHIHILINRVHPDDGRMLSSSKEKLNLSKWAESYEQERGKIYCEERVANNEARDSGEYKRGAKDQHRRLFEEITKGEAISNDNRDVVGDVRKHQKLIDAKLSQKGRALADEHRLEWQALHDAHKVRKTDAVERAREVSARLADRIRKAYQPAWDALNRKHETECELFETRERKLSGRLHNSIEALRTSLDTTYDGEQARIGDLFKLVASKSLRQHTMMQKQHSDSRMLRREQQGKAQEVKSRIKEVARIQQLRHGVEFLARRKRLIEVQLKENRTLQAEWRERHKTRRHDWFDMARKNGPKEKLKSDFSKSAEGLEARKETMKEHIKQRLQGGRDKDKSRDGR